MENIENRFNKFKEEVILEGQLKYSKRLIEEFTSYWGEPNRAKKPKMRWELEKTWRLSYRLAYWANRTNRHNPYLSNSEKTIEAKKKEFASLLKPYLAQYGADMLNEFYRHWSQPENKAKPEYLRWEQESHWELGIRLKTWFQRNSDKNRYESKRER